MILFLLSLLAGALTVLAPCTISLLPVIVGGSINGEHNLKRALIVTGSLGVSVIVFTLLLKVSTSLITIPPEFWQFLSGGIILLLGLTMIFPSLWDRMSVVNVLNRSSNRLLATGFQKQSFLGDVLVGTALGPVFSSCSPAYFLILATVLPRSFAEGFVYLLAYTFALCAGLLVVTLASQKILQKLGVASNPKGWLKRSIGILFMVLGVAIIFGYEKKLELAVANSVFDVTKIEQHFLQKQEQEDVLTPQGLPLSETTDSVNDTNNTNNTNDTETASATGTEGAVASPRSTSRSTPTKDDAKRISDKSRLYPLAPEIVNPSGFINTGGKPITFGEFKGKKVVLVDFWTYSCINCQRTLPYLKAWYDKYHDQGLEIISIHTPEFGFEKVQKNVEKAVQDFDLKYPVVLDNDYSTWTAFKNQFWPRKYLIDIDGYIVYDHAGEGAYDVTEQAIQKALAGRSTVLNTNAVSTGIVAPKDVVTVEAGKLRSPEIYFGSARNEYLGNGRARTKGAQTLSLPTDTTLNTLYLEGPWNIDPEYAENTDGATIVFKYQAKNVYMAAGSDEGVEIEIYKDDVFVKKVMVGDEKLYTLITGMDTGTHTLKIKIPQKGLKAFTFTFG